MKYPNRLRVWRAERDITQRDLAVKAGITYSRYWEIENGYREASPEERTALATVLGVEESGVFPEAIAS